MLRPNTASFYFEEGPCLPFCDKNHRYDPRYGFGLLPSWSSGATLASAVFPDHRKRAFQNYVPLDFDFPFFSILRKIGATSGKPKSPAKQHPNDDGNPSQQRDGAILIAAEDKAVTKAVETLFREMGWTQPTYISPEGDEVMQYISGEGIFRDRKEFPWPVVLVLDFEAPMIDGLRLLSWLRDRPESLSILTIILSPARIPQILRKANWLGVDAFLTKPITFASLSGALLHTPK